MKKLNKKEHIIWYKKVSPNTKIQLKIIFESLCGIPWDKISFILTLDEKINILFVKLKNEGFDPHELIK